jgi:hypothetical protein
MYKYLLPGLLQLHLFHLKAPMNKCALVFRRPELPLQFLLCRHYKVQGLMLPMQ